MVDPVADPRTQVVAAGYDALGETFDSWAAAVDGDPWERYLGALLRRLPADARALDLGCGSGTKTAPLAERSDVVGVDVSAVQLVRAREAVPGATFVQGDISCVAFEERSFDAVIALYSLTHVPREQHAGLFARIAGWLRPGGLFVTTLSARGGEDWTGEWLGVEMFFSGHGAATNRRLLREAGFDLLLDEVVTVREPEGDAAFLWVLARERA